MDVIPDTSSPSTEESVNDALALERVKAHFLELDDREQKILFLRHFQDLSVKEIAAAMELSEGRISQIYHKSVVKLRAMLKVRLTAALGRGLCPSSKSNAFPREGAVQIPSTLRSRRTPTAAAGMTFVFGGGDGGAGVARRSSRRGIRPRP
jgi:hypothetical protein